MLGSLLFNIHLNDLFHIVKKTDIWMMEDAEYDCVTLVELFRDDFLTLDADKCHLLTSRYDLKQKCSKITRFDNRFRIDF